MAKGHECPHCGYYMYAITEDEQPRGTWVVYQCRACGFKLKTFEKR